MIDMTSTIKNTISISQFNRGLAGKIFEEVRQAGAKVVMKNNAAECVLLSPEQYLELVEEVNDARLLMIANERMQTFDSTKTISSEEFFKSQGITDEDLKGYDEVEFEWNGV